MARLRFTGPEGSKFGGLDLVMVRPGKAKLRDLAEVQRSTGLKMEALRDALTNNESLALQTVVFLTLRNSGRMVTFDEAGDIGEDEIEAEAEAGDLPEETADPTSARSGSTPGDEPAAASKAPRVKPSKSGSKTRSAAAS